MHNDPTEKVPAIEPTQYAYHTRPLETDYYGLPSIPPPPPRTHRNIKPLLFTIACILFCLVVATWAYIGFRYYYASQDHLTPTPTSNFSHTNPNPSIPAATAPIIPTPTTRVDGPGPVTLLTASDIYNKFVSAGLPVNNPHIDNSWQCCTYFPEYGAIVFTDIPSGYTMDIAVFASLSESGTDSNDLGSHGYWAAAQNGCLLSWSSNTTNELPYYNIMLQACS